MKRPAAAAGFTCLAVLYLANVFNSLNASLIGIAVFAACALVFFILRKRNFAKTFLIMSLSAVISLTVFAGFFVFLYSPDLKYSGKTITVNAKIVEQPYVSGSYNFYILKPINAECDQNPIKINGKLLMVSYEKLNAEAFDTVKCSINIYEDVSNTINRTKGIYLSGFLDSEAEITKPTGIREPYYYAIKIREYFGSVCNKYIGNQEGALAKAIVLGDKEGLSDTINNNFKATGLSHTMAVSGMNIAFIVGFLLVLFDLLNIKRRITYIVCIIAALSISAVAGFSPSVVRAMIMALILFGGMFFFKESEALNSLGLAVLVICLFNPFAARDVSLLLSLFATLGIIMLSKPLTDFIKNLFKIKKFNLITSSLSEGFSASIAATLFTIPIIANYFGFVSVVSIPANILAVFAVSLTFLLAIFTVIFSFIPFLPYLTAFLCKLCCMYLIKLTAFLAALPFSRVYADKWYVYVCSIGVIMFLVLKYLKRISVKVKTFTVMLIFCALLTSCFTADVVSSSGTLKVKVIDVGQGDSIEIVKNNCAVLVDGGKDSYAGSKAIEEIGRDGVVHLKAILLTHYHADHAGGLSNVILTLKPDKLILPPVNYEGDLKAKLIAAANASGTDVVRADDDLSIDALSNTKIEYLTKQIVKDSKTQDFNELSAAVRVEYKNVKYLLLGDLDTTLWRLTSCYGSYLDCDVIKVGHHGSANSVTDDLLKVTTPKFAIISVGLDNTYKHPSQKTLDMLNKYNIIYYRTDLSGTVTAYNKDSNVYVSTEGKAS